MKVWEVRFALCSDGRGNWLNFFNVETDEKEYKLVGNTYYEVKNSWVRNEIPSKIKIKHIASGYLVECGFEYLPNDEELQDIKQTMIQELNNYLEYEFNQYELNFKSKVKGLFSDSK